VLEPSVAATAQILADRCPGEALWFWFSPEIPSLLVYPVDWDPALEAMNQLQDKVTAGRPRASHAGRAIPLEDGRLQLVSSTFTAQTLPELAAWVRGHAEAHPGLGRLRDCELVRVEQGVVKEIFSDPPLWDGVTMPTVPGTLEETQRELEALAAGESAWFWMTMSPRGLFLSISRVANDPDGAAFTDRMTGLAQRFPGDADLFGTVTRLPSGTLLFSTSGDAALGSETLRRLELAPLEGAVVVEVREGEIVGAMSVGG
jgi:hypothetical protein